MAGREWWPGDKSVSLLKKGVQVQVYPDLNSWHCDSPGPVDGIGKGVTKIRRHDRQDALALAKRC